MKAQMPMRAARSRACAVRRRLPIHRRAALRHFSPSPRHDSVISRLLPRSMKMTAKDATAGFAIFMRHFRYRYDIFLLRMLDIF